MDPIAYTPSARRPVQPVEATSIRENSYSSNFRIKSQIPSFQYLPRTDDLLRVDSPLKFQFV